jgi:hypothetical protein
MYRGFKIRSNSLSGSTVGWREGRDSTDVKYCFMMKLSGERKVVKSKGFTRREVVCVRFIRGCGIRSIGESMDNVAHKVIARRPTGKSLTRIGMKYLPGSRCTWPDIPNCVSSSD